MIFEYSIHGTDGCGHPTAQLAYGCPVEVFVFGRRQRVIYQFPGGGQRCAVVHLESGMVMAYVTDQHAGHPQTKAQTALNERLTAVSAARFEAAIRQAPVINRNAKQVGFMA